MCLQKQLEELRSGARSARHEEEDEEVDEEIADLQARIRELANDNDNDTIVEEDLVPPLGQRMIPKKPQRMSVEEALTKRSTGEGLVPLTRLSTATQLPLPAARVRRGLPSSAGSAAASHSYVVSCSPSSCCAAS